MFKPLAAAALLLAAAFAAGCAGTSGAGGMESVRPGDVVEFDGQVFQLRQVQEDFVLLRYREPGGAGGGITGFVDEVFRVSRYDLGAGQWYSHAKLPGTYVQWVGLDSFALAHDKAALRGAEVVMLR
jgi:hypothetical protein